MVAGVLARHSRQDIVDPHAVQADPATTAMVSMALLRSGNTLIKGEYSSALRKALDYLLKATETLPRQVLTLPIRPEHKFKPNSGKTLM